VESILVVVDVRRDVTELGGMRTRGHDRKPVTCWRGVSVGGNDRKPISERSNLLFPCRANAYRSGLCCVPLATTALDASVWAISTIPLAASSARAVASSPVMCVV
jgi:hypothetical protein